MKTTTSSSPEDPITSCFSSFLRSISSYNSTILLAALVSLLLVILFVLLLHFYARYFWSVADEARRRRRRRRRSRVITRISSSSIRGLLDNSTTTFSLYTAGDGTCTKGLDSWAISSIPLFVYDDDDEEGNDDGLECVICLSMLEAGDVGRKLGQCGHGFHVECIDMWLASHSTCPLCRSPVLGTPDIDDLKPIVSNENNGDYNNGINGVEEIRLQVLSSEGDDEGESGRFVDGDDNGSRRGNGSSESDEDENGGSPSVGCSLKRILSRSRSDRKAVPSSSNNATDESDDA